MSQAPTTIVLVHGGSHGAWCWEPLIPALRARGFDVVAFDLPGLGADETPPQDVSFEAYVERTGAALGERGPVLLVGHSMGGPVISQAAEQFPGSVARLVYLAALLPLDGEAIASPPALGPEYALSGAESSIARALTFDEAAGVFLVDPQLAPDVFYSRCDPATARWATERLRPQASRPMAAPLGLTSARWGVVPKTYVVCAADQALPPVIQRGVAARVAGMRVLERPWDHAPFLSDPEGLADLLAAEARVGPGAPARAD